MQSLTKESRQTCGYDFICSGAVIIFDPEVCVGELIRVDYSVARAVIAVARLTDAANINQLF